MGLTEDQLFYRRHDNMEILRERAVAARVKLNAMYALNIRSPGPWLPCSPDDDYAKECMAADEFARDMYDDYRRLSTTEQESFDVDNPVWPAWRT